MSARRLCLACLLALPLVACQPAPTNDPVPAKSGVEAQANAATKVAAPVSGTARAAAGTGVTGDHVATRRYKIDISYPALGADEAPLLAMLHKIANAAKREFMQALPDPKQFPEFADRQMQLLIDFKVAAHTSDFVSVRETGMQDTGGAHPLPIDSTIVYDAQTHRTVTLDDLFAQSDAARKALADYARVELTNKMMAQAPKPGEGSPEAIKEWKTNAKQMIDEGTEPTAQNFANFAVRAGSSPADASPGLTLIFPPYQVAPYVYGTQTVDVPTRLFAEYLKPQYHAAFDVPTAN
ncbi:MAG: DUF3298 domain-containing protein [Proteobacteria bacterium]|nr:DUF3298 domain-containing protein [Pseudomonadota bacterium]